MSIRSDVLILPVLILDALTDHLNDYIGDQSRDRSKSPVEDPAVSKFRNEHRLVSNGSVATEPENNQIENDLVQDEELEFASFVRVVDLARDHRSALTLHRMIQIKLNGFRPDIGEGSEFIKTPLIFKSSTLVPPRGTEPEYRYQSLYKITVLSLTDQDPRGLFLPKEIDAILWRSPVDHISDREKSVLFSTIEVKPD